MIKDNNMASARHLIRDSYIGGVMAVLLLLLAGCSNMSMASTKEKIVQQTDKQPSPISIPNGKDVAILAGGCFWCTEAIYKDLKGIEDVEPGYAGGTTQNPTYEQVCSGSTGHAESIKITFDPKVISYHDILSIFFTVHDPTTLNRQGADMGTQYRSAIFYINDEQKHTAIEVIHEIQKAKIWPDKIVTEVTPYSNFYAAEDYHHNYFARNPQNMYCQVVIAPKVAKFREHYRSKLSR